MLQKKNAVAIIGMGCLFPDANGLKQYWRLLFNGEDAVTGIPEETHWKLEDYFHKDPSTPDHTYCNRGGFIPPVTFDPTRYGMPPNNLSATDTSQLLGLMVAEMALQDAGLGKGSDVDRHRINVIMGVTGTQELVISLGARLSHPIWKKALKDAGVPPEKRREIMDRIAGGHVAWQENSFPGLLGNVVAGRIANRLDLGGTNSVVDAACASSMGAIHTACMELQTGKCDISLTGGVDTLNDIFMHMCFSKTGVLSHTSDARPFSKDADGTVLGEGVGMLVLKRLADAERDGDRIYAVLKSMGTSSDGKTSGIYAPHAPGQLRALSAAYREADISPDTVELIEAHGTGTRVGDKIELTALKSLVADKSPDFQCALGSVKSMIGHAKAAAGVAGIIKAVLSLHHKVIPPTLKAAEPDPDLDLNASGFYLNPLSKPWVQHPDHPRRCGVSAFGFGGSNFHAVLEEYTGKKNHVSWDGSIQIAAFSGKDTAALHSAMDAFESKLKDFDQWDSGEQARHVAWETAALRAAFSHKDPCRLLILLKENQPPTQRLARARQELARNTTADWQTSDIFFGCGARQGKLGFLFPGQGSQYTGMGRDLFSLFPEAMETLNAADKKFNQGRKEKDGARLTDFIFAPPAHVQDEKTAEKQLRQTDIAQPAIGTVSLAMGKILQRFGITPAACCGHSFGELSALCASEWLTPEAFLELAVARGNYMAAVPDEKKDRGAMLAVKAPLNEIEALIETEKLDLVLANRNSRDQGVLSGSSHEINRASGACKKKKLRCVKLPVAAAFHSRLVKHAARPLEKKLSKVSLTPTSTAVFSNTTGKRYPEKQDKARALLGKQLLNPVHFVENIEAMVDSGITTFLEVGPKTVLSGLTRNILAPDAPAVFAMDASCGKKKGLEDLATLLCALAASGYPVALDQWEEKGQLPEKKKMRVAISGANVRPAPLSTMPPSPPMEMVKKDVVSPGSRKTATPVPSLNKTDAPLHTTDQRAATGAPADFQSIFRPPHSPTPVKTPHGTRIGRPAVPAPHSSAHSTSLHSPEVKGADMKSPAYTETGARPPLTHERQAPPTSNPQPMPASSMTRHAMELVHKGLESMQALQAGTARAHEKFLETQTEAGRALQQMMTQTRLFADTVTTVEAGRQYSPPPASMQAVVTPPNGSAASPHWNPHISTSAPVARTAPEPGSITPVPENGTPPAGSGYPSPRETVPPAEPRPPKMTAPVMAPPVAPEPAVPIQPAAPAPVPTAVDQDTAGIIMACVSRLTGFPTEMLDMDMDMESDLGIDSIKRVEIMSELEKALPDQADLTPANMGTLKTLKDVFEVVSPDTDTAETQTPTTPVNGKNAPAPVSTDTPMMIIMETISDLTGFPVEMLEPGMDLESDLGIDSIKRVEILSRLEESLPQMGNLSADDMAGLQTLEQIAGTIGGATGGKQADKSEINPANRDISHDPAAPPPPPAMAANIQEQTDISPASPAGGLKKKCLRQVIDLETVLPNQLKNRVREPVSIAPGKKIYLTRDRNGVADHLKKAFEKKGFTAAVSTMDALLDRQEIKDTAGVVIIADPQKTTPASHASFLKKAFLLARQYSPVLCKAGEDHGAIFATISAMDGKLGFGSTPLENPSSGGMAGLVKTAALEWHQVTCTAVDLSCDLETAPETAETMVELMTAPGLVETGVTAEQIILPRLKKISLETPAASKNILAETTDLFVITGGARGVTARCALELARSGNPTIVLLGRSPLPEADPEWLLPLTKEADIKKALLTHHFNEKRPTPAELEQAFQRNMANREVRRNIKQMEGAGSRVRYVPVDIRDRETVNACFKEIVNQYGPVTGVIHGAGVVADRFIQDKTPEQFDRVFDTKVKGLDNILAACPPESLKYLVLFSSVAARAGNTGQADYAMANEVLNKTAQHLARTTPQCKIISLNWGPWEGGMVTPSLKREFEKRGIPLIPLDAGAHALIREMAAPAGHAVEMVLGGVITPDTSPEPTTETSHSGKTHPSVKRTLSTPQTETASARNAPTDSGSAHTPAVSHCASAVPCPPSLMTVARRTVSMDTCPVLAAHVIGGEPVLPFALMVEWFAQAAVHAHPGLVFSGVDDMRVLKGVKPGTGEANIDIQLGECTSVSGGVSLRGKMISEKEDASLSHRHAGGTIQLAERLPTPPVLDRSRQIILTGNTLSVKDMYEKVLFHGKALQGIRSITGCSTMGIEVLAQRAPAPGNWLKDAHSKWQVDPLLMDAAFQAAIIWCHENRQMACLPTAMANLRIYPGMTEGKGDVSILFTVNEQSSHLIKGYFTFIDEEGNVIAGITGFEAIMETSLLKKFKPGRPETDETTARPAGHAGTPKTDSDHDAFHAAAKDGTDDGFQMKKSHVAFTNDDSKEKTTTKPLFCRDKIMAFAVGKPSYAFGAPYQVFDKEREIARLPGPPYFFMDRVMRADHPPWELKAGGWIEAEFDMPGNGWYFTAAGTPTLPFCILLEIALQPCGWLAAYAGSALHSEDRLYFRNLGGEARFIKPVHKDMGTLTMRSRMTGVSKAGGLIIQDFDMEVLAEGVLLYQGHTNFGFFTRAALSNQTGIKNSPLLPVVSDDDAAADSATAADNNNHKRSRDGGNVSVTQFTDTAPLTPDDTNSDIAGKMPAKALRMVDAVEMLQSTGGNYQKGYIHATKTVDPQEWFFKAHFHQDPVCPGSLGVESFLQMIQYFAFKEWDLDPATYRPAMTKQMHKWIYRGQITPSARHIDLHVHIKEKNRKDHTLTADGILLVDGLCIYQMEDFTVTMDRVI